MAGYELRIHDTCAGPRGYFVFPDGRAIDIPIPSKAFGRIVLEACEQKKIINASEKDRFLELLQKSDLPEHDESTKVIRVVVVLHA